MYILNDLKDFNIYKNRKIVAIDKSDKNRRKDTVILMATMLPEETICFYNTFLYKNNYRSFYVPYKFHTVKRNKIITLDQKNIYATIKKQEPILSKKLKTVDLYKDNNLIYDLSYETKFVMTEYKSKGIPYIKAYLSFLENRLLSLNYKNKIVAVPVENNTLLSKIGINNNENPFSILYTALYKNFLPETFNGVTFIFYTTDGYMVKFTVSKNLRKSDILRGFNKISKASIDNGSGAPVEEDEVPKPTDDAKTVLTQVDQDNVLDGVKVTYLKNLGVQVDSSLGDNLQNNIDKLNDLIDDKIGKLNVDFDRLNADDIIKMIKVDEDILKQSKLVSDLAVKGKTVDPYVEKLKDTQDKVLFNGETLKDILQSVENLSIEDEKLDNDEIVNKEVKKNRTLDFDNSYYKKQIHKDMVNVLTSFNKDEDVKLFVKDIKAENTSDIFTKKMTYTVTFQDENKTTHNFKINYPILKDGKFIIAGGGRKLILKQLLLLPIVKNKPDTVQITTNYNKLFIYRFGEKLSDGTEFIKKLLSQDLNEYIINGSGFGYRVGNITEKNKGFITSLEYTELGKNFSFIENKNYELNLNQPELIETINKKNYTLEDGYTDRGLFPCIIDKKKKEVIYSNKNTGAIYRYENKDFVKINDNLIYFIIENLLEPSLNEEKMKEFYSFNPSKTLAYSRARVTGRTIPIVILLAYEKGLKNIIDRYGIKYEFIKSSRVPKEFGKKRLKFADGYLVYSSLDLKSTLLLDGLTLLDTSSWEFEQMNTKEPYIEYFYDYHGSRNIGKGLHNMLSLMVDPITEEVLKDLNLPTDIIDIILYANTLLSDSDYKVLNDMSCYRLRGAEQINAELYKILADTFKTYKDTSNNGNPIKISVEPDILFKRLNALKTVDEYSILNPSLEIDKGSSVTYKGPSGINLDRNLKMSNLIF